MRAVKLQEMALSYEILLDPVEFQSNRCLIYTNYFDLDPMRAAGSVEGLYVSGEHHVDAVVLGRLPPGTELVAINDDIFVPSYDGLTLADQLPTFWKDDDLLKHTVKPDEQFDFDREAVLIARVGYRTWGHWLDELLPKLVCVEAVYPGRFRYVLPEGVSSLDMLRTLRQSLEFYGVGPDRWILAKANTVHKYSALYAVSPVWGPTHKIHPGAVDLMRSRVRECFNPTTPRLRTALLRTESRTRNVGNVQEVCDLLSRKGYRAVELGKLSFSEQVEVFARSSEIVSVLGSGLAGLGYAPKGVKVMTLAPHDWTDLFFFALMQDRDALLADIRGRRDASDKRDAMTATFVVPMAEVERGLRALNLVDNDAYARLAPSRVPGTEAVPQTLDAIGVECGTHKSSLHNDFLSFYERFFASMRHSPVKILEIGVFRGASLRVWERYFPNALVVGIDTDSQAVRYASSRIKIRIADQSNVQDLVDTGVLYGPFDIIVDDGAHAPEHQITTLKTLFPFLIGGGFYIVEGLHTSFAPRPEQVCVGPRITAAEYLKKLLDYRTADELLDIVSESDAFIRTYARSIEFVAFCRHACLIQREYNKRSLGDPAALRREIVDLPLVPIRMSECSVGLGMMAHIGMLGDVVNLSLPFVNVPEDFGNYVQGVELRTSGPFAAAITYRARDNDGHWTDWANANCFVGTRGMGRNLTGFAVQLAGPLADSYVTEMVGAFAGQRDLVFADEGKDCVSRLAVRPLRSLQVLIRRRRAGVS